ncbi:LPS export ABC transporter periplasmic protein LptC [Marinomonas sp. CT5]|uniref:LPS export ABC transporter periplasmic protein LptC n=1 Tax=Marinomonas sp. CT5 TaxID=2066133 RepID=UPI001BAF4CFB|nr:LPS export ABC transporter periplasmic protein LptC [Marinomonas sp. CT5]QUX96087.1 LPS export ABC transporter periplasmic protein LptC [Marinomonas sp. CT5]
MPILRESSKRKKLLLLTAVLLVMVATFWVSTSPTINLVQTDSLNSSPDYFITNVKVKEFDKNGQLIETLDARKTLHYIQKSTTILESPNVKRQSKAGYWSAEADKGLIEDGSNDILLTGHAKATKNYLQTEDIKLNAASIHYLDKDQSLTSYGNPILISTQGETSANTIKTFINSEEVLMTGSVRGKYETIH